MPAEDDTPAQVAGQPETRRYRARYLIGNKAVGQYSEIYTETTIP